MVKYIYNMSQEYSIKLLKKIEIAKGTMAFHFSKPEGFVYKAGQSIDLTLINPPETDAEGNTRAFTLSSSPFEDSLMITTRLRDTAFKRVLKNMAEGTELKLAGPFGSFTLPNNSSIPVVFITGGIGVTPARSIITQASHDNLPHRIYLFYANRTPEDAAFLSDLKELQTQNHNFTFVPTMTKPENAAISWSGETGYVNHGMLTKHIEGDIKIPLYYLSGPAGMVAAMRTMLIEAGINEDNLRTEEFPGY